MTTLSGHPEEREATGRVRLEGCFETAGELRFALPTALLSTNGICT